MNNKVEKENAKCKKIANTFLASNLTDVQLNTVFPDWENLFSRIEACRNTACFYKKEKQNCEDKPFPISISEYNIQDHTRFSNIFSIFGGRGSGKSSVLFTLRNKLLDNAEKNGDLVLPIVLPELVDDDNTLIGWVLASLGPIIDRLEKMQKHIGLDTGFFGDCMPYENSLKSLYESISKKCFNAEASAHYSYVENQTVLRDKSTDRVEFYRNLNKFWERLQEEIKKYANNNGCDESYPLIIIMFDDIDLSPERCTELLMNNIRCFSNPNVVVIVSAAYKFLKPTLSYRMLEKIAGTKQCILDNERIALYPLNNEGITSYSLNNEKNTPNSQLINKNMLDRSTIAFIDKVLPPSSRYFLSKFSSMDSKLTFEYLTYPNDSVSIERLLIDNIGKLNKKVCENKEEIIPLEEGRLYKLDADCSFIETAPQTEQMVKLYVAMFGEKPRSITNSCTAIIIACERLCDTIDEYIKQKRAGGTEENHDMIWDQYAQKVYEILHQLLSALLDSIPDIKQNAHDIALRLLKLRYNNHSMYVNYQEVSNMFREDCNNLQYDHEDIYADPIELNRKKYLSIYMILAFVENLAALTVYKKSRVHVMKYFMGFIYEQFDVKNIFAYEMYNEKEFFINYSDVIEMLFNINGNIYSTNNYMDIYLTSKGTLSNLKVAQKSTTMYNILSELYKTNYKYCMALIKIMFLRFSNINTLNVEMLPAANSTLSAFNNWASIYRNNIYMATRIAQLSCVYMREEFSVLENHRLNTAPFFQEIKIKCKDYYKKESDEKKYILIEDIDNIIEQQIKIPNDYKRRQHVYIPREYYDFAIERYYEDDFNSREAKDLYRQEEGVSKLQRALMNDFYRDIPNLLVYYENNSESLQVKLKKLLMDINIEPAIDRAISNINKNSTIVRKQNCGECNAVLIKITDMLTLCDAVAECIDWWQRAISEGKIISEMYNKKIYDLNQNLEDILESTQLCWPVKKSKFKESLNEAIEFVVVMKSYMTFTGYLCALKNRNNQKYSVSNNENIKLLNDDYKAFIKEIAERAAKNQHSLFSRDALFYINTISTEIIDGQIINYNIK